MRALVSLRVFSVAVLSLAGCGVDDSVELGVTVDELAARRPAASDRQSGSGIASTVK